MANELDNNDKDKSLEEMQAKLKKCETEKSEAIIDAQATVQGELEKITAEKAQAEFETKKAELQAKLEAAEKSKTEAEAKLEEVETEKSQLQTKLEETEKAQAEFETEKTELQAKLAAAEKTILNLKAEIKNNQINDAKKVKLNQRLAQLTIKITTKQQEIDDIKNDPNSIENIADHLEEKDGIEKQIININEQINKLTTQQENKDNKTDLINCQELLTQLITIQDSIKNNYEIIEKINDKMQNDKSKPEINEVTQQAINNLLQMLKTNETIMNDYQQKIEILNHENSIKVNEEIKFYQDLINSKKNDISKIEARIKLLNNNNIEKDNINCCQEIKEKLSQLILIETDKIKKNEKTDE